MTSQCNMPKFRSNMIKLNQKRQHLLRLFFDFLAKNIALSAQVFQHFAHVTSSLVC